MRLKLLVIFAWILPLAALGGPSPRSSETLRAQKGLFRLMSADINEESAYHFRTSVEYFRDHGLLKDSPYNSLVSRTRARLAFGYAIIPEVLLTVDGGFDNFIKSPRPAQHISNPGEESTDIFRGGLGAVATYDIGQFFQWRPNRLNAGLSLWIDFSKISRFFSGPNIIPTLIVSTDWADQPIVPVRAHFNLGFRPANGDRFFEKSQAVVSDFERFSSETINDWALTTGIGAEFPFDYINPSLEIHMEKVNGVSFSRTPKWMTVGLKGKPFPQKNIELFWGCDIGLYSFKATPSGKPAVGPMPPWNIVAGFGIAQFGRKAGEIGVDQREYENVRSELAEKEKILAGLQRDLEYNTIQGRVIDADTKKPLGGVTISFPENQNLRSSRSEGDGRFIRYFKTIPQARILFSKDGYESSSKFVSLKPGERVTIDIELRKGTDKPLSDFVVTILDDQGRPIGAQLKLANTATSESFSVSTDSNGQVSVKIPAGSYRIEITSPGYSSTSDSISFQSGRTVLRSYTLSR